MPPSQSDESTDLAALGPDCEIQYGARVGLRYRPESGPARIGAGARIRSGSVIYGDVEIGRNFQTGHNAVIREFTSIGDHVVVGTGTVVDGRVRIGDFVKIESNCYIPTHVVIGNRIFLGPNSVLTNDRYPLKQRDKYRPEGPVLEDGVTLGAGVVVCPGVRIGADSFVAAGAVVTKDVPAECLVVGNPGRIRDLPRKLRERNMALSWASHFRTSGTGE